MTLSRYDSVEGAWQECYELAYPLTMLAMEAVSLSGDQEATSNYYEIIRKNAKLDDFLNAATSRLGILQQSPIMHHY